MNNEVRGYFLQIWDHFEAKSVRTKSLSKRAIYKVSFENLDRILKSSSSDFQKAFKQPGLYIITWWGTSRKKHKIYIGKSDQALRNRLRIQRKSNRFQNASEIFLLPFNTHFNYISYFEKRLIKEYQNSVALVNQQIKTYMYHADPEGWDLSDSDRSRFDKIIIEIKELLTLLSFEFGELFQKKPKYKLQKPTNQKLPNKTVESNLNIHNQIESFSVRKQKYHVQLQFKNLNSKEIYVLKNSYTLYPVKKNDNINSKYQKDIERIKQKRNELLKKGILMQIDDKLIFTQNHLFKTPSTASQFITGRSSNGWTEFEIKRTLNNIEKNGKREKNE